MKAVIYARVSSTTDRQNTDRQVSDLTAYAVGMSYEVCEVFTEHVSGAKKNKERPVLQECLDYCKGTEIDILLVSELSRLGRNALEVLVTIKDLKDNGINLYLQKEQFILLDKEGKPSLFAPIMLATLATCAELERENIQFRLNSGRKRYIEAGGKLGRPEGTGMTKEDAAIKYKQLIKELKAGTSIRKAAKLCDVSESTAKRIKKTFGI